MVLTEEIKRKTANYLASIASKLVSREDDYLKLLTEVRDARRKLRQIESALEEYKEKGTANYLNALTNEQRNPNN